MTKTMQQDKQQFRHDSLQDTETIQQLLKAITRGIARGKLSFSDEDGEIVMQPQGLIDVKLTASKEDGRNRMTLRLTWQDVAPKKKSKKSLKVK